MLDHLAISARRLDLFFRGSSKLHCLYRELFREFAIAHDLDAVFNLLDDAGLNLHLAVSVGGGKHRVRFSAFIYKGELRKEIFGGSLFGCFSLTKPPVVLGVDKKAC